jgi:methylated-DNA-protein-cysteine methyltransferase related protein
LHRICFFLIVFDDSALPHFHHASAMIPKRQQSSALSVVSASATKQQDFFHRVHELVMQVPFGRVTTYGHIAAALGAKSSARLVGYALNGVSAAGREDIPCHRVINRNGELSGKFHFATPTLMRELLEAEEVGFVGDAVDLKAHLWIPPSQQ